MVTGDFASYIVDRTRIFTEREWVFKAINAWLADTGGPRVFLLTGKPGSGKTAIARRLREFWHGLSVPDGLLVFPRNFLSAAYFCSARAAFESISESSPDPSPFILPDETEVFRNEDFVTEGGRGAT